MPYLIFHVKIFFLFLKDILRFYGQLELDELELMRTNRMLDTSNGISVRMPHKVEKKEK